MTGRSKVRIFAPGGRRVGAVPPRALHAAPAHGCPQCALSDTRTRQRDTKHTAVHALYCSMCLAVLRIPTCAPTELPPPNVHCLCPNPLTSAGRRVAILIIPPHARSYTIVDGIIVGIIIVIILSHASSSCLPCNPRLPICPNFPTRSPHHASNTLQRTPARLVIWPFGHLAIWSFGRLSVGLWDPVAPAAVFTGRFD